MNDVAWLAKQFEANRKHLHDVACRILGSTGEAEDAVQETWMRISHADTTAVANVGGWLTTVTSRICLDMLRSRRRRHASIRDASTTSAPPDPACDSFLADSVGAALLVVLERLTPSERVAFVLHDMFDLSFDDVARIIDRSEAATRQLASRARRRVQLRDADEATARAREDLVAAFLAASRDGNLDALLAILHGDVRVRADAVAVRVAAASRWLDGSTLKRETRGSGDVAAMFKGRAHGLQPVTIDGEPGAAWIVRGRVRSAVVFAVVDGRIAELEIVMDPAALAEHDVVVTSSADRPAGASPR